MELKHRILAALSKLSDRDTQQLAVEDLEKIVESLSPEGISMCLSCIYDTDVQQKGIVKKECIKIFGTLAALHGDLVTPHLPKIVASIVRRLKDPDTSVRDACVDAMGVLSANILTLPVMRRQESGGQMSDLATIVKPLFDALREQNKSVQSGAAMCLARVIESAKAHPSGGMARFCQRVCKLLTNPSFQAKAALLPVIASLSQVGAVNQQMLVSFLPCVQEALESNDWATRKAAAETLTRMASSLGPALESFKPATLLVLESCRFDKVKPVRDCVQDAIQIWRSLPGLDTDIPLKQAKIEVSGKEHSGLQSELWDLKGLTPSNQASSTKRSLAISTPCDRAEYTASAADKVPSILKKRGLGLTDKKPNPDFFQKLETQGSDDWHVEVAIPRNCPPCYMSKGRAESSGECNDKLGSAEPLTSTHSQYGNMGLELNCRSLMEDDENFKRTCNQEDHNKTFEDNNILKSLDGNSTLSRQKNTNVRQNIESDLRLDANPQGRDTNGHEWDDIDPTLSNPTNGSHEEGQSADLGANWALIQGQISQLEYQQASLMDLLQEFMGSSKGSMLALEGRIRVLERVVEDITQDLGGPSDCIDGYGGIEDQTYRKYLLSSDDYMESNAREDVNGHLTFSQRLPVSKAMHLEAEHPSGSDRIRGAEISSGKWNGHVFRTTRSGSPSSSHSTEVRNNGEMLKDLFNNAREDIGEERMAARTAWTSRDSGLARLGEGPSARSIWQASKDEATLAAIRVVGEDGGVLETEQLCTQSSWTRVATPDNSAHKAGLHEKQAYWWLWSQAIEHVQAGDVESAYKDVLCSGDELMLVRLMNKTGPVLGQLCSTTANEMLRTVGQLLRQQSFIDFSLPWIQQVADVIMEIGAECLAISVDVKKELLLSIQEAENMELPEGWLGNSVSDLLSILRQAWSME